jgi:hypothetical protein
MVFVYRAGFFFFNDCLTLNNVTLILYIDIDADVSIVTNMKYKKLLILRKKVIEELI